MFSSNHTYLKEVGNVFLGSIFFFYIGIILDREAMVITFGNTPPLFSDDHLPCSFLVIK